MYTYYIEFAFFCLTMLACNFSKFISFIDLFLLYISTCVCKWAKSYIFPPTSLKWRYFGAERCGFYTTYHIRMRNTVSLFLPIIIDETIHVFFYELNEKYNRFWFFFLFHVIRVFIVKVRTFILTHFLPRSYF